jgi:pimeloyl-ACP methyl ester carboxylesterase
MRLSVPTIYPKSRGCSSEEIIAMSNAIVASNITAPTQLLSTEEETYAYRRFGNSRGLPLLLLQHYIGTLDNWDPALTDPLAGERDLILFDNAGIGRSTGTVPKTVEGMAAHALRFLDALSLKTVDVLGFSLGGMVAQQMALERPSIFRKLILAGTAPRGGEEIMHLHKPSLAKYLSDPTLQGYEPLQKIFFAPTESSQAAGAAFVGRLTQRQTDLEPVSGPEIATAQMASFQEWELTNGERFADLKRIGQPVFVVNGIFDEMIPVRNSYWLSENLPNAVLLTYPDAGHASIFQFHKSFTRQVSAFLTTDSNVAPF